MVGCGSRWLWQGWIDGCDMGLVIWFWLGFRFLGVVGGSVGGCFEFSSGGGW